MFKMWCKEEEETDFSIFGARRDRDLHSPRVKIDLPSPFSGEDNQQSFLCWARQFEVAVRALVEGEGGRTYQYELARILPTRLSKAAFLLWDSLPATVQGDYEAAKNKLKEAFGQKQYLDRFRANLSARPRAQRESLVVYAAEISRLVAEAFPDYGKNATREEKFRRFLAGLDPGLRAKCHEQGATDMDEALIVAERCENAREAALQDYASTTAMAACATGPGGQIASVQKVTDYGGLHKAVHSLTEELKEMRMEMKMMAEENRRLQSRSRAGGWHGPPSPGRGSCYCACGGHGCRSLGLQRGRSPDRGFSSPGGERRPFTASRGQSPDSVRSSGRYSPSPGRRSYHEEETPRRRGVRFLSPHSDRQPGQQGNGV